MAEEKWKQNEDGTYTLLRDGNPVSQNLSMDDVKRYAAQTATDVAGAVRSGLQEVGRKLSIQSKYNQKLSQVRSDITLQHKLEDPEYSELYDKYRLFTPGVETFAESAAHELDDYRDGISDVIDAMVWKYAPTSEEIDEELIQFRLNRMQEHEDEAMERDALDEATGISTTLGKMVPYVLSGGAELPLGKALLGAAKGITGAMARRGATLKGEFGTAADTLSTAALSKIKAPSIPDKYNPNIGEQYLGTSVIGAAEGEILPGRTLEVGALENVLGTSLGRGVSKLFRRAESELLPEDALTMNDAKRLGKIYMPGVAKGDVQKQIHESTMRGNPNMANQIQQFDNANKAVNNTTISKTLGIENPEGTSMIPVIDSLRADLDNELVKLMGSTKGKFTVAARNRIEQLHDTAMDTNTPGSLRNADAIAPWLTMFDRAQKYGDVSVGGNRFDGRFYNSTRKQLTVEIDSALASGADDIADSLKTIRNEFDQLVESQMGPLTGIGGVAKQRKIDAWKGVRDRSDLVDMIHREGLDASGNIDMKNMHDYFMTHNKSEYLARNKSNPLNDFYALSKADELWRSRQGSGLGGTEIEGYPSRATIGLPTRAYEYASTPYQKFLLNTYRKGKFDVGLPPGSTIATGVGGAAAMQANAPHEISLNYAKDLYNSVDNLTGITEMVQKLFMDEEEEKAATQAP